MKEFIQKNKILMATILSVIITVAICITLWVIFFKDNGGKPQLTPDYPPQSIEGNQKPIDGDNSQKIPTSIGGGAINVTYAKEMILDLSDNSISLYYANPNASQQNVAISIIIGEVTVATSGLITPGNMVTELNLESGVKDMLSRGGYDATLLIKAYHPKTNEKAMVDTKADIIINVEE